MSISDDEHRQSVTKLKKKAYGNVVKFGCALIVLFTGLIFTGLVLTVLWDWFVQGYFGVKPISIPEALGLTLLGKFGLHTFPTTIIDDEQEVVKSADRRRKQVEKPWTSKRLINELSIAVGKPLTALIFGWVIHLYL